MIIFENVLTCSMEHPPNEEIKFFEMLQELWRRKLAVGSFRRPETYDEIKRAINTKWKAPKKYYSENIKAPRRRMACGFRCN